MGGRAFEQFLIVRSLLCGAGGASVGAFGDHLQRLSGSERQQQLELLANRAIAQLRKDANLSHGERIGTRDHWSRSRKGGTYWLMQVMLWSI